jgi:hypothetical protein
MSDAVVTRAALLVAALVFSTVLGPRVALPLMGMVGLLIVEQVGFGGRLSGLLGGATGLGFSGLSAAGDSP